MKKLILFFAVLVCAAMMTGCALMGHDSEVVVEVRNAQGQPVVGEKVYMYSGRSSEAILADPSKAKDVQETEGEYGSARFVIAKAEFLLEDKLLFIFETFDRNGNVNGYKAVTVNRNGMMNTHLEQN